MLFDKNLDCSLNSKVKFAEIKSEIGYPSFFHFPCKLLNKNFEIMTNSSHPLFWVKILLAQITYLIMHASMRRAPPHIQW